MIGETLRWKGERFSAEGFLFYRSTGVLRLEYVKICGERFKFSGERFKIRPERKKISGEGFLKRPERLLTLRRGILYAFQALVGTVEIMSVDYD